jgi:hypothetical protein
MDAKRYFYIVWLAFAVPWIAGTGIGVHEETRPGGDETSVAAASASCLGQQAGAAASGCPEKAVASLGSGALDAAGQTVPTDSSRSADKAPPADAFADGIFILGPPALLLAVYCVILLAMWLVRSARRVEIDGLGE